MVLRQITSLFCNKDVIFQWDRCGISKGCGVMKKWQKAGENGVMLYVKVTPNASQEKIVGEVEDADGKAWLSVRIAQPPEDGKANKALLRLLAKELRVPMRALSIKSGETSRWKVVCNES